MRELQEAKDRLDQIEALFTPADGPQPAGPPVLTEEQCRAMSGPLIIDQDDTPPVVPEGWAWVDASVARHLAVGTRQYLLLPPRG